MKGRREREDGVMEGIREGREGRREESEREIIRQRSRKKIDANEDRMWTK